MFTGDYSIEVDIWALGLIFLEMILGQRIAEFMAIVPSKVDSFPSESLLERVKDEKLRKMIRGMLQR